MESAGKKNIYALHGDNRYNPIEEALLFRPITKFFARILSKTFVTPDSISFLGFLFALFFGILAVLNRLDVTSIVILLLLCEFFDKLDGDLARAKGVAGRKGQYVDGFLDVLGEIIIIISLALIVKPSVVLAMLAIVAPLVFVYHGVSAPFYLDLMPRPHQESKKGWRTYLRELFSYGRAKFFLLIIVLALFGKLNLFFWILPILVIYTIVLFVRNIFIKKLTRRP